MLHYLQTERMVHPDDEVFGADVLLLILGGHIRSHHSVIYFYANGSFVRKKSLPYYAMNLVKKVLSPCISFAAAHAEISAQTLWNRREEINDQNAEDCHAPALV